MERSRQMRRAVVGAPPCSGGDRQARRALILALLVFSFGCGEENVEPEAVARPVKLLTIGEGGPDGTAEFPGTIAAAQHAEMAFEVQGKITELPVREGEDVEVGTVLARLDPRDYESRLAAARADLENARVDYERAQKLFDQDVLAKTELDRRRAAFKVAEAAFQEAQKAVGDAVLTAPFSGRVADILVEDFQNVQAKQPVLILQDASSLEIKAAIPERVAAIGRRRTPEEAGRLLGARVVLTSLPDRSFPATPKEFATTADPVTRTFEATFGFEPPDDVRVLPGMTAKIIVNAIWKETEGGAIRIPASATLASDSGGAYVWLVDPQPMTVRRGNVELGDLGGSEVAVLSGLEDGDVIAISGVHQLREGMQVRRLEN